MSKRKCVCKTYSCLAHRAGKHKGCNQKALQLGLETSFLVDLDAKSLNEGQLFEVG